MALSVRKSFKYTCSLLELTVEKHQCNRFIFSEQRDLTAEGKTEIF
jgi:hypothetical protein